jgi:hypothetical protein
MMKTIKILRRIAMIVMMMNHVNAIYNLGVIFYDGVYHQLYRRECVGMREQHRMEICINQNFSLYLSVQMDEFDESKFHDFVTNWEVAIGHLDVSFKLFLELTAVPFRITPSEDHLNMQSKLWFSPVKLDKNLDHKEIVGAIQYQEYSMVLPILSNDVHYVI